MDVTYVICIGPGVFQQILQATGSMSPEERAEYLENCAELAQIHATGAHEGQTEVMQNVIILRWFLLKTFLQTPDITEQLRLHFICFVEVDDHLYELDGRRSFPINHGKCSNFVEVYTNRRWIKHFAMSNIQCSI